MTTPLECDFTEYTTQSIPLSDNLQFPSDDTLYRKTVSLLFEHKSDANLMETTNDYHGWDYLITGYFLQAQKSEEGSVTTEEMYVATCYSPKKKILYFVVYELESGNTDYGVKGFKAYKMNASKIAGCDYFVSSISGDGAHDFVRIGYSAQGPVLFGEDYEFFYNPSKGCFAEGLHENIPNKLFVGQLSIVRDQSNLKVQSRIYISMGN